MSDQREPYNLGDIFTTYWWVVQLYKLKRVTKCLFGFANVHDGSDC